MGAHSYRGYKAQYLRGRLLRLLLDWNVDDDTRFYEISEQVLIDIFKPDRSGCHHPVVRIGDPIGVKFDQIKVEGEEARLNWIGKQAHVLLKEARGCLKNTSLKEFVSLILQEEGRRFALTINPIGDFEKRRRYSVSRKNSE